MYEDDGSPSPGLDKMARDTDGDGFLDKAVIIIAVDEAKTAKEVIDKTQEIMNNISNEKRPCEYDQNGDPIGADLCDWEDLGIIHDPYWTSSDYKCGHRVLIQVILADFPACNCSSCSWIIHIPFRCSTNRILEAGSRV